MHIKRCFISLLFTALICSCAINGHAASDKCLEGIVDVQKLALSLAPDVFSDKKKTAGTELAAQEALKAAGWTPNSEGVFIIRLDNAMLSFKSNEDLKHFYIMPLTRRVIMDKRKKPVATGSYVVVSEDLENSNYAKMSGFGYIGRGSHVKGIRYGFLPFNQDFIRLLGQDKAAYIFTMTGVDVNRAKQERFNYELLLKCRFTSKVQDYIRIQENVKTSSSESTHSRKIMEYLLCVDVVGAIVYDSKNNKVLCEWKIAP